MKKYRLNRKSLEDSVNLNLSSSITIESRSIISENNCKRQRIESPDPLKSSRTEPVEEQTQTKKTKTKGFVQPPIEQITLPPLQEVESPSESPPPSFPSTNTRMRELKSKTPAWKAQKPLAKGDTQGNPLPIPPSFLINSSR